MNDKLRARILFTIIFIILFLCSWEVYQAYVSKYHFTIEEVDGKFTYIEYMHHNPLGVHSTMGGDGSELCSSTLQKCWKNMSMSGKRSLIKTARQDGRHYFINVSKGTFIKCLNCNELGISYEGEYFNLLNLNVHSWRLQPDELFYGSYKHIESGKMLFSRLLIKPEGVHITHLLTTGDEGKGYFPIHKASFSPNGEWAAWIVCDEVCGLVKYHLQSETYSRIDTNCGHHRYLEVKWEHEVPVLRQNQMALTPIKDGGILVELCTDSSGKPSVPVWGIDELKEYRAIHKG